MLHVLFNRLSIIYISTWPEEDIVTVCSVVEGNSKQIELSHLPRENFLVKTRMEYDDNSNT